MQRALRNPPKSSAERLDALRGAGPRSNPRILAALPYTNTAQLIDLKHAHEQHPRAVPMRALGPRMLQDEAPQPVLPPTALAPDSPRARRSGITSHFHMFRPWWCHGPLDADLRLGRRTAAPEDRCDSPASAGHGRGLQN
eukprot:3945472-Alexandrium_andersonii.AAC.1